MVRQNGDRWGGGYNVGKLVEFLAMDQSRVSSYYKTKIQNGDLALCTAHAGDWFCDYRMLVKNPDGTYRLGEKFGAYECGSALPITERSFHLLMAGENVDLSKELNHAR